MCTSSCGLLYKEGKPLKEITCPCGLGYWDIFRERFVSGDQIREGEPPRHEYEAKVRAMLKQGEFEARLREQWIKHFFCCPTKLALDEKAIREGTGDTSSRRKAEAELREIARGDFKSRGRSLSVHEGPRRQLQGDEGGWRDRATSPATSSERSFRDTVSLSDVSTPLTTTGTDTRHTTGPEFYTLFGRHRPAESVASGYDQDTSTALGRFFLPGDGIRQDVLEHHRRSNTFGTGATVQSYTSPDGRRGYLIRATTKPTTELISRIRKDSVRVEESMRQKAEIDQQASVNIGRREGTRPDLASAHRDSQTARYPVDDIARETQDLRSTSDRSRQISDRGQYDRPQRSVIESPLPIIERRGRREPEDLPPERESIPRELGDTHIYSTDNPQDVDIARRGDLRYRREPGDVIVARRDSRPEPREVRYYQRESLHEPRDTRTTADTRRQATTERPRDRQGDIQDQRTSRRDTRRDPRNTDDHEFEDLPSQRRHDASRH